MPDRVAFPNIYAGPYLDRAARLRDEREWHATLADETAAWLVPVWQTRNLVEQRAGAQGALLIEWRERHVFVREPRDLILLGEFRGRLCFAIEYPGNEPPAISGSGEFVDLRSIGGNLPADEAGLLAYARAMVLWRSRHRFCGTCGAPTVSVRSGHVLKCTRCEATHFPRIDPAIIVLVSHGEGPGERALLGRQATWPEGRYSTIAGFVEPGESLEDAVAREVVEETGIEVAEITYQSSQPWPFPSSLMLGFTARARTTVITCHDGELEDARWLSRDELAAGAVRLPPSQSISFRLIEAWLSGQPHG